MNFDERYLNWKDVTDKERTVLIKRAREGDADKVATLIRFNVDVNQMDSAGCTALYYATKKGHLAVATLLLDRGADHTIASEDGALPLHMACYHGHLPLVSLLLRTGSPIDHRTHSGHTSLMLACAQGLYYYFIL